MDLLPDLKDWPGIGFVKRANKRVATGKAELQDVADLLIALGAELAHRLDYVTEQWSG